ncbi:MAG: hypothetical protein VB092_00095 [Oscillospiraceae bacterium]|nr:hypothetical protein [Oscillospiraceae bacterium]
MDKYCTAIELLTYKMHISEQNVWESFCGRVHSCCSTMEIQADGKEIIDKKLKTSPSPDFYRGFHEKIGYYELYVDDRGELNLKLQTAEEEEALWFFLKSIASDVGYKMECAFREQNLPKWRYGIASYDHVKKQWNENPPGWFYTVRYDGRLYWFGYAIRALEKYYHNCPRLNSYISQCTEHMNRWFKDEHWIFDKNAMRFVEARSSVKITSSSL